MVKLVVPLYPEATLQLKTTSLCTEWCFIKKQINLCFRPPCSCIMGGRHWGVMTSRLRYGVRHDGRKTITQLVFATMVTSELDRLEQLQGSEFPLSSGTLEICKNT